LIDPRISSSPEDFEHVPRTTTLDLSNCAAEPIHIPGHIQPHGALVVASAVDLRVLFVSANLPSILGIDGTLILGNHLRDCLDAYILENLIRRDEYGAVVFQPLRSYRFSATQPALNFEIRQFNHLIYIEIEPDTSSSSEESVSTATQRMVGRMRSARSMGELLQAAATELRELTGYDRVMSYQFAEDGHGIVVAEDVDPEFGAYLGLHYPASDIPAQARRLYLMQRIRVIADCSYEPVPIFADSSLGMQEHATVPLDLTFCNLRSISPIHIEYLRNMDVSATMTLSLIVDDELWGLMVCHHRTPKLPSPAIRSGCDLISQMTSFLIRSRIEQDAADSLTLARTRVKEIVAHLEQHEEVCHALAAAEHQLLSLVGAIGALICFEGKVELIGRTPGLNDCIVLLSSLHAVSGGKVIAHDSLSELLPEFAKHNLSASGVMLMPVLGSPENTILWFRPEFMETVNWGGDPEKPVEINSETGRVSPRKSFKTWATLVKGRSQQWKPSDLSAANELRRSISDHILARAEGLVSTFGMIDSLTLLPNRRRFQTELHIRSEKSGTEDLAVILVNLDRFKQVNEAFGHPTGDQLLVDITRRFAGLVSRDVFIARLGADEFAVLCTGDMASRADEIGARIHEALAVPFEIGGKPFRITASLGIAHSSQGEKELLRAADTAMHFAKQSGRNKLVAFNKLLQDSAVKSLELQQDMYRALDADEFKVVYQPIVALRDLSLHGFEALLRWQHPTKGTIPPLDFIPLAEETGLILEIGKRVLFKAVEEIKQWADICGEPLTVHVNVAAPQLVGPHFVQDVQLAIQESSLSPSALSIEVTESVLMRGSAVDTLSTLKALGVEVSIDDFGTGYSSLAYLQELPVDIVKIDKTFINTISTRQKSKDLIKALLALVDTLGLKSIAEGVESESQSRVLAELGCGFAQGYVFSRPLDAKSVNDFITSWKGRGTRLREA
jgi:diguanylate cyclase (GGDEF)-like protein